MEHHGVTNNENRKKKNQISVSSGRGGGGIAGLLVFGGALAVTGLIAVASIARKKSKAERPHHKPTSSVVELERQESDDTTQGLPSLLQDSTTNDEKACYPSYETSTVSKDQIDSYELLPSQTLILEEKLDLKVKTCKGEESPTSLHQEIALSNDSPPESAVSSNQNGIGEECLESSFDSPCFKVEEVMDKSKSEEPVKSVEISEVQYENATTETEEEREEDIAEDDDDDDEDVAFETSENSSEATGRTSLDSHEAAIWPAELIEEHQEGVKGEIVNIQSQAEGTAKPNIHGSHASSYGRTDNSGFSEYVARERSMASDATSYKKANLYVLNHQLSVSRLITWIIPVLLLALLHIVLLNHRRQESSYAFDVDGGNP